MDDKPACEHRMMVYESVNAKTWNKMFDGNIFYFPWCHIK